jgi:hypothetical protein
MTQDEQYLKEKVESACLQAEWQKYPSYPKLLKILRKIFSAEYLVDHEKEIQGYANAWATYHGTFDFASYFLRDLHESSNGSGNYDSHEMIKNPEEPPISEKMRYEPRSDFSSQAKMSEDVEVRTFRFQKGWHGSKFLFTEISLETNLGMVSYVQALHTSDMPRGPFEVFMDL